VPTSYRLSTDVVCRQTNSDLQMLFDRRKGVMYELNETASAIVGQLSEGPMTSTQIVAALQEEFDATTEEIASDVERLLADFTDAGLLVPEMSENVIHQS
jgi:PqqD family protein of HPr-rel-A system